MIQTDLQQTHLMNLVQHIKQSHLMKVHINPLKTNINNYTRTD
jgi:hypothetical protein